jgi:hypothetical protein
VKILSSCRGTTVVFEPEDTFEAQETAEAAWRRDQEQADPVLDAFEDALERDEQAKADAWLESNYDENNGDIE